MIHSQFDYALSPWFSRTNRLLFGDRNTKTIRPRREKRCRKKESRNFLADDLHPSCENRTAKPLVCSFFRHVSSPLLSDD